MGKGSIIAKTGEGRVALKSHVEFWYIMGGAPSELELSCAENQKSHSPHSFILGLRYGMKYKDRHLERFLQDSFYYNVAFKTDAFLEGVKSAER